VKLNNIEKLIEAIIPELNKRLASSDYSNFTGLFQLNFYQQAFDFGIVDGEIESLVKGGKQEVDNSFSVNPRWFALLLFGDKSWQEIRDLHPDVSPTMLAIDPKSNGVEVAGEIMSVLFLKFKGWINLKY
jgi:hypothetical protein